MPSNLLRVCGVHQNPGIQSGASQGVWGRLRCKPEERFERNKGQVVYFVKPRASFSVVAEDKKSKLAEMVGGGSA